MRTAETEMVKICAIISPHTPRELCTTAEGVAWLVDRLQASKKALTTLEEIRCDKLAAHGQGPEATAISAARHLLRHNVKEHAPSLAGASVETGVEVHATGDVAHKAASDGCCVSSCSDSSFWDDEFVEWNRIIKAEGLNPCTLTRDQVVWVLRKLLGWAQNRIQGNPPQKTELSREECSERSLVIEGWLAYACSSIHRPLL